MTQRQKSKSKLRSPKPDTVSLSSLRPNERNPRKIADAAFSKLQESIRRDPEFIELRPIVVDEAGVILGGNQRYRACLALGMTDVPTSWVRVAEGLTEEQRRRFVIVDNSPEGMAGEWDFDILSSDWKLPELADLGFLEDSLRAAEPDEPADAEPQMDKAAEVNRKWRVKRGDVWLIGDHRLCCGDSTARPDVESLLGKFAPFLTVTDPPYGVEYDASWRSRAMPNKNDPSRWKGEGGRAIGAVVNDDRADWKEAWSLIPGDVAYVWHAGNQAHIVAESLISSGFSIRAQIVWAKNNIVIGRGNYHPQHEPCWYCVRSGKPARFTSDRSQTTLWQIDKPHKSETGHSTQKPVECMARPIRNHDCKEVYDPFLGSGTTMVACQNLGRRCFGMEISPDYCAVVLQRMKDAFGLEGKRV